MVKKGWGFRDHGPLKSGISRKWFDEFRRLIELFLCNESDGYPLKLPTFAVLGWHTKFLKFQLIGILWNAGANTYRK